MAVLRIYRGLPGSGKSTAAHRWTEARFVFEADKYPARYLDGLLNPAISHAEAHRWCQLQVELAMQGRANRIAVANTLMLLTDLEPYIALANEHNYFFKVFDCKGEFGSVHQVPPEIIERMRLQWQPYR